MHIFIQLEDGSELIVNSDRIVLSKKVQTRNRREELEEEMYEVNDAEELQDIMDELEEDDEDEDDDDDDDSSIDSFTEESPRRGRTNRTNRDNRTPRVPEVRVTYRVYYEDANKCLNITETEYNRVKGILQVLNGDLLKQIEGQVADMKVKEEFKKQSNALFRMEV